MALQSQRGLFLRNFAASAMVKSASPSVAGCSEGGVVVVCSVIIVVILKSWHAYG
jgi:hypothetical protein